MTPGHGATNGRWRERFREFLHHPGERVSSGRTSPSICYRVATEWPSSMICPPAARATRAQEDLRRGAAAFRERERAASASGTRIVTRRSSRKGGLILSIIRTNADKVTLNISGNTTKQTLQDVVEAALG